MQDYSAQERQGLGIAWPKLLGTTRQWFIGREQLSLGPHGNRHADYSMQQRNRELLTVFGGLRRAEGRRGHRGDCQAALFMEVWEDSRGGVLPTQRQLGRFSTPPTSPPAPA